MISKVMARGQIRYDDKKSFNLSPEDVFDAGWMTKSLFRNVIDMIDSYKLFEKRSTEKIVGGQRTNMVFLGVNKAFLTFEKAKAYLDEPLDSQEMLLRVVFKIAFDFEGDLRPMDAKKFLDEGAPATNVKNMPYVLF